MSFYDLISKHNIVLDESVHYSVIRAEDDPNMFALTLKIDEAGLNVTLPVHIAYIGSNLRMLARCGCIADCIDY